MPAWVTRRGKRRFLQLYTNVKRSKAYHGLGRHARNLLFEIIDRHNGINNGMIGLGVREAAYELRCSQTSAYNAMRQLDDSGLARPTKIGTWRGRKATERRLMFLRCDKTREPPVSVWEQRVPYSEFTIESAEVHHRERRYGESSPSRAQKPNSSMNQKSPSSPSRAHIHMYQGERGTGDAVEAVVTASKPDSNQEPFLSAAFSSSAKTPTKRKKGASHG